MPTLSEFANDVPQCQTCLGIESCAGLVEKQHLGIVRNGPRNLHALRKAARQRAARTTWHVSVSLNSSSSSLDRFADSACGNSEVTAMKVQVLVHGALPVEGVELRHDAHVATGLGRMFDHVDAGDGDAARGGQRTRGAHADGGALAGSVRTEQAEQFSALDREVDAFDGLDRRLAGIGLYQLLDVDNCVG